MDGGHGLSLATTGEQEFGRLEKMEEEEAAAEHSEGHSAECEDQVAPALVISGVTACYSGSAHGAGHLCCLTGIWRNQTPGD